MAKKPAPIRIAEVGAFKHRSREDSIRRTAAMIEIAQIDTPFAIQEKKFEAINLADGRDFLQEDDTYDMVIVHSVLSPGVGRVSVPGSEEEVMVSDEHTAEAWRERLVETGAKYIVVCEGQPYTLSGYELGNLPGYRLLKSDQWVAVYRKKSR